MVFFVASVFFDAKSSGDCGHSAKIATKNAITSKARPHIGKASWYGPGFLGRHMASGKVYRPDAIFVAHRSYRFGTTLRITNLQNNKVIVATVEDRGPYIPGRSLDLSRRAAKELAMVEEGVTPVSYEVIGPE
jgi:rare lipoprotein A